MWSGGPSPAGAQLPDRIPLLSLQPGPPVPAALRPLPFALSPLRHLSMPDLIAYHTYAGGAQAPGGVRSRPRPRPRAPPPLGGPGRPPAGFSQHFSHREDTLRAARAGTRPRRPPSPAGPPLHHTGTPGSAHCFTFPYPPDGRPAKGRRRGPRLESPAWAPGGPRPRFAPLWGSGRPHRHGLRPPAAAKRRCRVPNVGTSLALGSDTAVPIFCTSGRRPALRCKETTCCAHPTRQERGWGPARRLKRLTRVSPYT